MTLEELKNTLDKDPYVLSTEANKLNGTLSLMIERGDGEPEHHKIKAGNSFGDLSDWINGISAISINAVREFCNEHSSDIHDTFDVDTYLKKKRQLGELQQKLRSKTLASLYRARLYQMFASYKDSVELPTSDIQALMIEDQEMIVAIDDLTSVGGDPKAVFNSVVDEMKSQGWDLEANLAPRRAMTVVFKHPLFDKPEDD